MRGGATYSYGSCRRLKNSASTIRIQDQTKLVGLDRRRWPGTTLTLLVRPLRGWLRECFVVLFKPNCARERSNLSKFTCGVCWSTKVRRRSEECQTGTQTLSSSQDIHKSQNLWFELSRARKKNWCALALWLMMMMVVFLYTDSPCRGRREENS